MKTLKIALTAVAATTLALTSGFGTPRTFVSGFGNDANTGSVASPKRSFAGALTVTDAGGEIVALDSAGYGGVTINKAVSIIAPPGVYGGVTVGVGETAIAVSITATDSVVLRGLSITGVNSSYGISFSSAGKLYVQDCVLTGFTGFNGDALYSTNAASQWFIRNSLVQGNKIGMQILQGKASLDHVFFSGNNDGLIAGFNSKVTVTNSSASGNTSAFQCQDAGVINLEFCTISNNTDGVVATNNNNGGVVRISNSTVTDNTQKGLLNSNATIQTRSNNTVRGNGTDVSGALTAIGGT